MEVLDGRTDEAFHWIQVGIAMGRHASEGPELIQALVGVAITSVMAKTMEDLIQAPGTPSLYWAFANRPRPFVDMSEAVEGEQAIHDRELRLREVDNGVWSVEHARQFTDSLQRRLAVLIPFASEEGADPGLHALTSGFPRLGMAAMVAQIYPEARRALLAQGRPVTEVDAMPTAQVALIYTVQEFDRLSDDAFKWTGLPYRQTYKQIKQASQRCDRNVLRSNTLLGLFAQVIPIYSHALLASVRLDRQLDAQQCIEAIRLYAAAHGGALPPALAAITEVPVPTDPATGTPFEYTLAGSTATLKGPVLPGAPSHVNYMIRFELKLGR